MSYRLTKKFRFESAHRLVKGYVGKCSNLHGHSWNGELVVELDSLDAHDMAIDFGLMGRIVRVWEDSFDHRTILHREDPIADSLIGYGLVLVDDNPTCETLARLLAGLATKELNDTLTQPFKVSVRIEETCTTSCTYTNA